MANNSHNIEQFAADAVARLYSGEMSDVEERNLEAWLQVSKEHRREFNAALELWDAAGDAGLLVPSDTVPDRSPNNRRRKLLLGLAASVIAAVGTPIVFQSGFRSRIMATRFDTKVGETREIELSDGSRLTLNTNTSVLVAFSETSRRIILDRGEAFFDIAKDPDRPLTVSAGDQQITVLGTSFSVNRSGATVTVAVIEGRVAVQGDGSDQEATRRLLGNEEQSYTEQGEKGVEQNVAPFKNGIVLLAGDVVRIANTGKLQIETVATSVERFQSWRYGYVRFDNEELGQIVQELNRYTNTQFVVKDTEVAAMKVSGVFRTADITNAVSKLELVFPIVVLDQGDHYLIVSKD